ncbi:proline dehydrogenase family protein [Marivirga sp. S37H4]|uniref:Proline dehydrogenase family protein n=1 Tax=Marivirga aurantiaca TaxID=2802615 RepID=A0A934WXY7_9BACT|nr:proline dehydrogenase family protein [Marivirga aurantiaca]MBK6265208.1 proline dehydrogenase family protein [Marivirga aurantiaca]
MEVTTNPIFENVSIAFSSKSDKQLRKAYLLFSVMNRRWLVNLGKLSVKLGFALRLPISGLIRNTIYDQFCGGVDIDDSQGTIDELAKYNIGSILDYSIEGADTDRGFEETTQEILRTIERSAGDSNIPFCVFKITGIAMTNVFEKVQNKVKLTDKEHISFEASKQRIEAICEFAYKKNVRLFVDAEESWIQKTVDEIVYDMMSKYNKEKVIVYNTFQMYRWDMMDNLKEAHKNATKEGYHLGVKLVRGAYMEKEAERAERKGYPNPIQPSKTATDLDYNTALEYCIENIENIALCSGSHNQYSNYFLTVQMEKAGLAPNDERVYSAQLYGMSDNISFNLADKGYNVAKYVPYGPVKAVMPYLFRRAEENTAMAGQSSREFLMIKEELQRRKEARKQK